MKFTSIKQYQTELEICSLPPKELLLEMLTYKRNHGSVSEGEFIYRFILPLANLPHVEDMLLDEAGNIYVKVGGASSILYTAHTDTMHRTEGRQVVILEKGEASVGEEAEVLGADDGAGVWLLIEMIKAGVPCWVQFTRGEERGCIGSKFTLANHQEWLTQFTHAIAFDRRANHSIITWQMGQRACSDDLGNALIDLLDMGHELDPTGSYTDTATYMDVIPECVNISIGYNSEHSKYETLDTVYALALREKLISIDWDSVKLPVKRDPADISGLEVGEVPLTKQLVQATSKDITRWVANSRPELVTWLIQDLLEEVISLEFQLEDNSPEEEDYLSYHGLKAGMQ